MAVEGASGFLRDRLAPVWDAGQPLRPGESVSEAIARFRPDTVDKAFWSRHGPILRRWAELTAPQTPYGARTLLSVLTQEALWAERIGLPFEAEVVLHPDTIDRFVTEGLAAYEDGTRINYRRHLRLVGEAVLGTAVYPPRPVPINRDNVLEPYTKNDVTRLLSWARGLSTPRFRHGALGMMALGLGAGLTSQEQSRLVGTDIRRDELGVVIEVIGDNARSVPVLDEWADAVAQLGIEAGTGPVLMPERTRITRHQLKNFLARCPSGDAPVLDTGRLRATWICTHLAGGTNIAALEAASGVRAGQLVKYRVHVPPMDPDEARRQLHHGGPR